MGGFTRTPAWWFNYLKNFFLEVDNIRGKITLGYGVQQVQIDLDVEPKRVSLSVQEPPDVVPVCVGGVNLVGAKLLPQGFILYADIQTTTADVSWIVEYGENPFPETPEDRDIGLV